MFMATKMIELSILFVLAAALIITPMLLIVFGFRCIDRARRVRGGVMLGVGVGIFLGYVWFAVWILDVTGPGHDGVLAQGNSPHGLEYCVVQTFTGTRFEPYQVSFYIRDDSGAWHWSYLEHEDLAWRSARVEFAGDFATVFRNDKSFRTIPVPTGIDADSIPVNERHNGNPARCTVTDLLRIHNKDFGP